METTYRLYTNDIKRKLLWSVIVVCVGIGFGAVAVLVFGLSAQFASGLFGGVGGASVVLVCSVIPPKARIISRAKYHDSDELRVSDKKAIDNYWAGIARVLDGTFKKLKSHTLDRLCISYWFSNKGLKISFCDKEFDHKLDKVIETHIEKTFSYDEIRMTAEICREGTSRERFIWLLIDIRSEDLTLNIILDESVFGVLLNYLVHIDNLAEVLGHARTVLTTK